MEVSYLEIKSKIHLKTTKPKNVLKALKCS